MLSQDSDDPLCFAVVAVPSNGGIVTGRWEVEDPVGGIRETVTCL